MSARNANDIFTTVLKLREPWFTEDVIATSDTVNVTVATRPGVPVACPLCMISYKVHDSIDRTWKHTDADELRTVIRITVRRS
jgi:hypothetical protein